jgi:hypothetical protein
VFNEAVAGGAGGLAFARVGEDGATLEGAKALCEVGLYKSNAAAPHSLKLHLVSNP